MIPVRFWAATALIALAATSRVLPHPENVAPVAALALFGASTFRGRLAGALVPLAALLLSDALLEATHRAGWQPRVGFYPGQWVVYACLAAPILLGFLLRHRRTVATVASATLASSLVFFLVTNLAYFAAPESPYPKTAGGLLACYASAVPFFRNSLLGDLFYSAVLFGAFALAERRFPALRGTRTPRDAEALVAS
jgi:hypothetical protein